MGAEKFFNIACRVGGFSPDAVVLIATIRALKLHGGSDGPVEQEDPAAVERGLENLGKHIENMQAFGNALVVAINQFPQDHDSEIEVVKKYCEERGVEVAVSQVVAKGGEGGIDLAEKAMAAADSGTADFKFLYEPSDTLEDKIEKVAKVVYGADQVEYHGLARKKLKLYQNSGYAESLICNAKTQSSLSDDPSKLGRPTGFKVSIRDVELSAGAGFVVPIAGPILRMPGLPTRPAAEDVRLNEQGEIEGLS